MPLLYYNPVAGLECTIGQNGKKVPMLLYESRCCTIDYKHYTPATLDNKITGVTGGATGLVLETIQVPPDNNSNSRSGI